MLQESDVTKSGVVRRQRSRRRSRRREKRGFKALIGRLGKLPFVKWLPGALVTGYVAIASYNWYADTAHYLDVDLGSTRNQALYALGPSPTIVPIRPEGERLDFLTPQSSKVSVVLSGDGKVRSVRCAIDSDTVMGCPAMFGISPGESESDMYGWLGVPDQISVRDDVLTADYTSLGVKFELRQFKIVAVTHYSEGTSFGQILRFARHLIYLPGGLI